MKIRDQFKNPRGFLGGIAGKIMAMVGVEKNQWTISLLNIKPGDHVLEIGFGPGIAIQLVSNIIHDGKIVGIDYSEKMYQQASKRNRYAIQTGKVQLINCDVENLPAFDFTFDKVFSINSIMFWENPVETLKKIRKIMNENATIAITIQPFMKGATDETAKQFGFDISNHLTEAGFTNIKIKVKHMKPRATSLYSRC